MKKMIIIAGLLAFLAGCEKNIYSPENADIKAEIPVEKLVGFFGIQDSLNTVDKVQLVEEYFAENSEAWMFCFTFERDIKSIPAKRLSENFSLSSSPYKSYRELKIAYKGIAIKTPYVNICRIIKNQDYYVTDLFQAPGPFVYTSTWKRIIITE